MRCLLACFIALCLACQGKSSVSDASAGVHPVDSSAPAAAGRALDGLDGLEAPAGLAPSDDTPLVRAELLTAAQAFTAGAETLLALRLTMAPGWHVYWRGANDTGLPLSVSWELPPGVTVGPLSWPAPERYVSDAGLLDHVYFDELLVLATLSVPAQLPQEPLTVAVQLDWLVCDETCLPGDAHLQLTLPVRPQGATVEPPLHDDPGDNAQVLHRALAALPGAEPAGLSVDWSADQIALTVPGASGLAFFPRDDGLALAEMVSRGESAGNTLQLLRDRGLAGGDHLVGILAVHRDGTAQPSHHLLELAPPTTRDQRP